MAAKEEEDRIQGVATNRANFLLGNLGESKSCATLQVNVVGKGECSQRGEWRPREEVGRGAVYISISVYSEYYFGFGV